MKRLGILMEDGLLIELKIKAVMNEISMSEYVRNLIILDLQKEKDASHPDK